MKDAEENSPKGREALIDFFKGESSGLYKFLEDFIVDAKVPQSGGIVFAGWSTAAAWPIALLAYASSFVVNQVDVVRYIRRVVTYGKLLARLYSRFTHTNVPMKDASSIIVGFQDPPVAYVPLFDPTIPPEDLPRALGLWLSSYWPHSESDDGTFEFEQQSPLTDPLPTIFNMTPADLEVINSPEASVPGGPDASLINAFQFNGNGRSAMRIAALYPEPGTQNGWEKVEWRYIWCDRSPWIMPYGAAAMREELANAKKAGRQTRKVVTVRWRGANHQVSYGLVL